MGNNLKILPIIGIAVLAIAIIVLVGIAVLTGYSKILRTDVSATENGITVAANTTLTQVGTLGEYPFIQTIPSCVNATDATDILTTANYAVVEGATADGANGFVLNTASASYVGETVNCSLTYLADANGQNSADTFIAGLAIFGTFMAVIVLALIGKLIVGFFVKGKE